MPTARHTLFTVAVALALGAAPACAQSPAIGALRQRADRLVDLGPGNNANSGPLDAAAQQAFADRLLAAIENNDIPAGNACLDWYAMADTAIAGVISDPDHAAEFARGFKLGFDQAINKPSSFMGTIFSETSQPGASYKLLRFHEVDGAPRALFRLNGPNGINYHDFLLTERGGRVVASDIYIFASGELFTDSLRRTILPAVQQLNRNWLAKLVTSDQAVLENFREMSQFAALVNSGQGTAALQAYDRLPREMQTMKLILLLRYRAAAQVNERAIQAAYEDFEAAFPDDPALLLLAIDGLIVAKEYDKALASVDKLDEAVGGDNYLNFFRASIELARNDPAAAKPHAQALVAGEPDEVEHRFLLIGVLTMAKDYPALYAALNEAGDRFGLEWNDLRNDPQYSGFVASREGKRWLYEHGFTQDEPEPMAEWTDDDGELLSWTDKSGRFSVEARFVEVDPKAKTVKLVKPGGETLTVPIARLSAESREQAKRLYERQKAAP